MSLFEELIEGKKKDKQIVKSFETKETLSDQIFEEDSSYYKYLSMVRISFTLPTFHTIVVKNN